LTRLTAYASGGSGIVLPTTSRISTGLTDGGKNMAKTWWQGFRKAPMVNSVKEDPKTKGAAFCGRRNWRVYVSSMNGRYVASPLQNNMPSGHQCATFWCTAMTSADRDPNGRGLLGCWDQMTPLREIATQGQQIASANAWLFKPGETLRWQMGRPETARPLPKEEGRQHQKSTNGCGGVLLAEVLLPVRPVKNWKLVDSAGNRAGVFRRADTPIRAVDTESD